MDAFVTEQTASLRRDQFIKNPKKYEMNRVSYILFGKSFKEIKAFATEYGKGRDWHKLIPGPGSPWHAPAVSRKYQPGEVVFDVKDDRTPYVFVGAMHRPGSSAWFVISPKGELKQLVNIQYAEENRYATKGDSFRRMIAKAIWEGS